MRILASLLIPVMLFSGDFSCYDASLPMTQAGCTLSGGIPNPECTREAYAIADRHGGLKSQFPPRVKSLPQFNKQFNCSGGTGKTTYRWEISDDVALGQSLGDVLLTEKKLTLNVAPCSVFKWKFIALSGDGQRFVANGMRDHRGNCEFAPEMLGLESPSGVTYMHTDDGSTAVVFISSEEVSVYSRPTGAGLKVCRLQKRYTGGDTAAFLASVLAVDTTHFLLDGADGAVRMERTNQDFGKVCTAVE